jgi:hypothetical protein
MVVFWEVALCSLADTDVSKELTAYINRVMNSDDGGSNFP